MKAPLREVLAIVMATFYLNIATALVTLDDMCFNDLFCLVFTIFTQYVVKCIILLVGPSRVQLLDFSAVLLLSTHLVLSILNLDLYACLF